MPAEWYIRKDGVTHGPASEEDLRSLLAKQRISLHHEASQAKEGPWRPLGEYAEFTPVRPIDELFAEEATPAPAHAIAEKGGTAEQLYRQAMADLDPNPPPEQRQPAEGALSESARAEFQAALVSEFKKKDADKPFIAACLVWILVLVLVSGLSKILAFLLGCAGAGISFWLVKTELKKAHIDPIYKHSDAMLMARYNEVKADQRAARTRRAIGWAVFVIVVVVVAIAWLATRN